MTACLSLRDRLIRDASAFCEREGIALSTLALRVVNDGRFFRRMEEGGDCATGTLERFYRHFAEHGFQTEAAA